MAGTSRRPFGRKFGTPVILSASLIVLSLLEPGEAQAPSAEKIVARHVSTENMNLIY
jgi:hypothetical protein